MVGGGGRSPEGRVRSAQAEAAFPSSQVFLLQQMKRPFYLAFFPPSFSFFFFSNEGKSRSGAQ